MKTLMRPISIIGSATLAGLFIRFVRFKVLAIYVGPYGIGVMGQAWNLLLLVTTVVLLGTRIGVIRYLAELTQLNRHDKLDTLIYTTFILVAPIAIVGGFICFWFSSTIAGLIFGDSSLKPLVTILSLAVPLMAMTLMLDCFLQGAKDVKGYSFAYILRNCLGLAIFLPLAMIWNLKGAVIAVTLSAAISFLVTSGFFKKKFPVTLGQLSAAGFDRRLLSRVLKVGSVAFIAGGSFALSLLLVRSLIIRHLGMAEHGIFQAAYGLVDIYFQFLLVSSVMYVTAHLSGLKMDFQVTEELNKFFRLALLGFMPIMMIILIFKGPLLNLIYTVQFARAGDLLPLFAIGSFFKIVSWMMGLAFIPILKLRPFLLLQFMAYAIHVILTFLLLPIFSLQGVMISHLISYAVLSGAFYVCLKRSITFEFSPKNRALFLISLVVLCVTGLLTS